MVQIQARCLSNKVLLVDVVGEIDIVTAEEFKSSLLGFVEEGYRSLIINFEKLEFIDSNGLRALLAVYEEGKERNAAVGIVTSHLHHKRVFRISGLAKRIDIFSSVGEAVEEMVKEGLESPKRGATDVHFMSTRSRGIVVPVVLPQERHIANYEI